MREVLLLSHSPDEEAEAREVMRPKVTLGPLCRSVGCMGELGGPGLDCELCDLGKWLNFSES